MLQFNLSMNAVMLKPTKWFEIVYCQIKILKHILFLILLVHSLCKAFLKKISISKMSHCHYLIITGKFGYNLGIYDGNSLIPVIALKTNGIVSVENIS